MFIIETPAPDRNLLTLAEIKSALGVSGADRDVELAALGLQISDLIAQECGVPRDGVTPPTLRRETLVETIRLHETTSQRRTVKSLLLARRFVDTMISISVDGASPLASTDYEVDKAAGLVTRLCSSRIAHWACGTIVVTYSAGFEVVPFDLRRAAITVLREQSSADDRDPLLKRYRRKTEGLSEGEWEYWVNASTTGSAESLSGSAKAMLKPYRYLVV